MDMDAALLMLGYSRPMSSSPANPQITQALEALPAFQILANLAAISQQELYLVGGTVRDLIRGVPPRDIDLCCEGDTLPLEAFIQKRWSEAAPHGPAISSMRRSRSTGLLKVRLWEDLLPGCRSFDISPAEKLFREINPHYQRESLSEIDWNLVQRDFTVNAMALGLGPRERGCLHDLFSGVTDLEAKCLRGLHEKLYLLDPVVSIRGAAAEARLGFRLSATDEVLIEESFENRIFDTFDRPALYRQIRIAFSQATAPAVATRLIQLGGLGQVLPFEIESRSLEMLPKLFAPTTLSELPRLGDDGYSPYALALLASKHLDEWKKFYNMSKGDEESLKQIQGLLTVKRLLDG